MIKKRPLITIVNSSTFGRHFTEHIAALESFADLRRIDLPADADAGMLTENLRDTDGIIASVTPKFTRKTLEQCPNLILLFRHGIGCDNVDLEAATELGIRVSRVKGEVEREAVAEYAVSMLFAAARMLPQGYQAVKKSQWSDRVKMIGMQLKDKTVGLIGLGNIGSRSAEILNAFGTKVLACDPYISKQRFKEFGAVEESFDGLIRKSNAILFHCPLTSETRRFFGKEQFENLQPGCILVNTCRGELLDEDALYEALRNGTVGCYATDVVEGEPIGNDHRLAQLDNVIITPHLGGYSWESLQGMGQTGVDDMIAVFQQGEQPGQLANPEVLKKSYRQWE